MEYGILYSACTGEHCPFPDPGYGFPEIRHLAGVFEMIARSLAGFGLVPIIGFTGVCLGSPIAWIMADAFLIPAYFHVSKVLQKRMVPQTDVPQAV